MNRPLPDIKPDWEHLFDPRSVAVIGASNTQGSWGYNAVKGLLGIDSRRIYPVNPNATEIQGIKAYHSVLDIPESIDLAVIVVSDRLVPAVLHECVAKPVKGAVVISAGFAETGDDGREVQAELVKIARQGGIRFIGPNSMGHADTRSQLSTFGQVGKMEVGSVAVLSQSGNMCLKMVHNLTDMGIDFSKYISTGNEADLSMEDYLEHLAGDDNTKLIAAYIEGLRDGRRFLGLARRITASKPVVVIKAGGTGESAKAVMSHTGALAGEDAVYSAAFKQAGVIRVADDDELYDVVYGLVNCPLPKGDRVGILSIGGGPGALATEACEKEGLVIADLEPSTIEKLDKHLPARWARRNPVDMAGPSAAEFSVVSELLSAMLEDANTDAIFLLAPIVMDRNLLVNRLGLNDEQIKVFKEKEEANLRAIGAKIEKSGKPVILIWQARWGGTDAGSTALLRKGKFLVQANARRAARILKYLVWYSRYRDEVAGK